MIVNRLREIPAPPLRRVDRLLLPAALLLLAPILVYASNGVTPLLGMLALAYLPRIGQSLPGLQRARQRHWLLPLGFLVAWTAVSAFWSLRPEADLVSSLQLALTMAAGIVAVRGVCVALPEDARSAARFLPVAVALIALLAGAEMLLDFPYTRRMLAPPPDYLGPAFLFLNNIARGMTLLLLLLWPAVWLLAAVQGRRLAAGGLVLLVAAVIFALPMGATKVALLASGAAGLLALWRPRLAILLAAGGCALAAAALAWLLLAMPQHQVGEGPVAWLPDSWSHRLVIWRYTVEHIEERPVIGFGFDASRRLGGELVGPDGDPPVVIGNANQRLPLHPHSMPLQVWLELGLVGLVAVGLMLLGVVRLIWRMAWDPPAVAMALASTIAWLVIACLSFGIWQTWWLCSAWLAVLAVVLVRRCVADRPEAQAAGSADCSRASTSGSAP